jgi:hypothetical protein
LSFLKISLYFCTIRRARFTSFVFIFALVFYS